MTNDKSREQRKQSAEANLYTAGPAEEPSNNNHHHGQVTPSRDFYKAAAYLSIWGPCRGVGDAYLNCVVTEGMGMCKPLRRTFEQCAAETSDSSIQLLDQLAMNACAHIQPDNATDRLVAQRNCAAQIMMSQQQQQQQQ